MDNNSTYGSNDKKQYKELNCKVEDHMEDTEESKKLRTLSVLYGVMDGIIGSLMDFSTKLLDYEINLFLLLFYRFVLIQIIVVIILIKTKPFGIAPNKNMIILLVNNLMYVGGSILLTLSLFFINIFLQGVLEKLKIFFGLAFARIFLKIPITILDLLIGVIVIAGVITISYFSQQNSEVSNTRTYNLIIGILCMVFMSAMQCVVGLTNNRLQDMSPIVIVFWQTNMGILISAIGLIAVRPHFILTWEIGLLSLLSALFTFAYMYVLNKSLQFGNMGLVFLGESSSVVCAFFLQFAYFKIIPSIYGGVGAGIVLIGVILSGLSNTILRSDPFLLSAKL